MKIRFFGDNGDKRYAGHTFDMVKCAWSNEENDWIESYDGSYWGIYAPGKGLSPFLSNPEYFGQILWGYEKEG